MSTEESKLVKLNSRVRHRRVGDDGVIVCMHNGQVLIVNEVGIFILEQLKQPRSKDELSKSISDEFLVELEQAETDLSVYLTDLCAQGVLISDTESLDQSNP